MMRLTSEQFKDYQELVSISKQVIKEYFDDNIKVENKKAEEKIYDMLNIVNNIEGENDG